MFEKRVKSRFSNRQISTFPADTFGDYLKVVQAKLQVPDNLTASSYARDFNANVQQDLLTNQAFLQVTRRIYDLTKDYRVLNQCLVFLPVVPRIGRFLC